MWFQLSSLLFTIYAIELFLLKLLYTQRIDLTNDKECKKAAPLFYLFTVHFPLNIQ